MNALRLYIVRLPFIGYKQDVLGVQVGATKRIGYEKDVLGKIGGMKDLSPFTLPHRAEV